MKPPKIINIGWISECCPVKQQLWTSNSERVKSQTNQNTTGAPLILYLYILCIWYCYAFVLCKHELFVQLYCPCTLCLSISLWHRIVWMLWQLVTGHKPRLLSNNFQKDEIRHFPLMLCLMRKFGFNKLFDVIKLGERWWHCSFISGYWEVVETHRQSWYTLWIIGVVATKEEQMYM